MAAGDPCRLPQTDPPEQCRVSFYTLQQAFKVLFTLVFDLGDAADPSCHV